MDCDGQCGSIVTERNRYFTGKLLVARDLVQEQAYFLGRHRLHNRLLHGWGVVCGLEVYPHPEEECAEVVVIGPVSRSTARVASWSWPSAQPHAGSRGAAGNRQDGTGAEQRASRADG